MDRTIENGPVKIFLNAIGEGIFKARRALRNGFRQNLFAGSELVVKIKRKSRLGQTQIPSQELPCIYRTKVSSLLFSWALSPAGLPATS
jgi:hypothetical protein